MIISPIVQFLPQDVVPSSISHTHDVHSRIIIESVKLINELALLMLSGGVKFIPDPALCVLLLYLRLVPKFTRGRVNVDNGDYGD
ncbi:MAG: hypothetical protein EZS28_027247 [Streblomastix strix]|uniref:Uncharacterized protein n=1 Tax=Streblomastix strix TaxID=222440 RepID=A0A5J4V2Q3_9EUKA|nr:MAG: hypothetical protein EZS28_027247 [Streblomastix strix]